MDQREAVAIGPRAVALDEVFVCVRRVELHEFDAGGVAGEHRGELAGDEGLAGAGRAVEDDLLLRFEHRRPLVEVGAVEVEAGGEGGECVDGWRFGFAFGLLHQLQNWSVQFVIGSDRQQRPLPPAVDREGLDVQPLNVAAVRVALLLLEAVAPGDATDPDNLRLPAVGDEEVADPHFVAEAADHLGRALARARLLLHLGGVFCPGLVVEGRGVAVARPAQARVAVGLPLVPEARSLAGGDLPDAGDLGDRRCRLLDRGRFPPLLHLLREEAEPRPQLGLQALADREQRAVQRRVIRGDGDFVHVAQRQDDLPLRRLAGHQLESVGVDEVQEQRPHRLRPVDREAEEQAMEGPGIGRQRFALRGIEPGEPLGGVEEEDQLVEAVRVVRGAGAENFELLRLRQVAVERGRVGHQAQRREHRVPLEGGVDHRAVEVGVERFGHQLADRIARAGQLLLQLRREVVGALVRVGDVRLLRGGDVLRRPEPLAGPQQAVAGEESPSDPPRHGVEERVDVRVDGHSADATRRGPPAKTSLSRAGPRVVRTRHAPPPETPFAQRSPSIREQTPSATTLHPTGTSPGERPLRAARSRWPAPAGSVGPCAGGRGVAAWPKRRWRFGHTPSATAGHLKRASGKPAGSRPPHGTLEVARSRRERRPVCRRA